MKVCIDAQTVQKIVLCQETTIQLLTEFCKLCMDVRCAVVVRISQPMRHCSSNRASEAAESS